jgi:hypothetical protein
LVDSPQEWPVPKKELKRRPNFAFWGFSEVRSPLGFVTVVVTFKRR